MPSVPSLPRVVLASCAVLVVAACPRLEPDSRAFACRTDADCVDGFLCGASSFCERPSPSDGGGDVDAGGADAGPVGDVACGFAALGGLTLGDGSRVVQFGGARMDSLVSLAAFPDGGLVAAGQFFADEPTYPVDGFVAFLSAEGGLETCVRVASSRGEVVDELQDVAVAPDGDVVAAGRTYGNAGGIEARGSDVLVVRVAREGSVKWKRQFDFGQSGGDPVDDEVTGVTVDGEGVTWVVGVTGGWFANHPERPSLLGTAGFVAALDAEGALIDARLVPDAVDNTRAWGGWPRPAGALVGAAAQVGFESGRTAGEYLHVLQATLDGSRKVQLTPQLELEVLDSADTSRVTAVGEAGGLVWLAGDVDEGTRVGGEVARGSSDVVVAWGAPRSTAPSAMLLGTDDADLLSELAWHDGRWHGVGYTLGTVAAGPRVGGQGDAAGWSWSPSTPGVRSAWQFGGEVGEAAAGAASTAAGLVVGGSTQSTLVTATWGDADCWLLFLPDPT